MCHRASESTAWQCACGYEFGQDVETVRNMLRSQLHTAYVSAAACLVCDLGVLALVFVAPMILPISGFILLTMGFVKSIRKIAISRESLRQLKPRDLPTARLLS